MTRVDFYSITSTAATARLGLACRITNKAYQQGMYVHLLTADAAQNDALDCQLWTYSKNSFLAHETSSDNACMITLGHDWLPEKNYQLLVNLANEVPEAFSRYERLVECIDGNEACRQHSRIRFRFYRDRGYKPQYHDLDA